MHFTDKRSQTKSEPSDCSDTQLFVCDLCLYAICTNDPLKRGDAGGFVENVNGGGCLIHGRDGKQRH